MEKGKLYVIEGACDGIGKTTQYELLKNKLQMDNKSLAYHHFPTYGTYQGSLVEEYLKGSIGEKSELSPYFINSLYAVDRAVTWYTKLKKLYENGNIIILDRYTTSSLFYQSALIEDIEEKKKFIDYVVDFEYKKLGIKEPDEVIFLTAPFELVMNLKDQRKINDGIMYDIHESDLQFMKKVYENSNFVANYLNWNIIECSKNDKMRDREDISDEIYTLIKENKKINK